MKENLKTIAQNKKAFHDYFLEESFEAGIELCGCLLYTSQFCGRMAARP